MHIPDKIGPENIIEIFTPYVQDSENYSDLEKFNAVRLAYQNKARQSVDQSAQLLAGAMQLKPPAISALRSASLRSSDNNAQFHSSSN